VTDESDTTSKISWEREDLWEQ